MTNEERRNTGGKPNSPIDVQKDEKEATGPARPQPAGKDPEEVSDVKTDAVIEDRFEATDN